MFFSPGLEQLNPDPDPALLAFVKCHVTSPVKWEVLRTMAYQEGAWTRADQLARSTHRQLSEVSQALKDLAADGIVEALVVTAPEVVSYRLPGDEPTSVVLHRLIEATTHSQELRAIIAAHLQHIRQQAQTLRTAPAPATTTAAA
jgi:DNA-binding HxlR family transcriptional regulator